VDKPAVLLVDDDEAICTLVTAILDRDFHVDVAAGPREAADNLKTRGYGAILLDIRTQQRAAFDVLDHMRRDHPELVKRVLVFTSSLSKTDMERVREHKVFGVISKPFQVDLLLSAVKECAGGRGGRNLPLITGGMLMLIADLWL
jgi:two-component system, NtrC family, response regulator AtoC